MDELFKTKADKESAISHFTTLQQQPGWKLLKQIVDANIEALREQLEEGIGEGETKEDIDRIRNNIKLLKEHINKPQDMIDKLQGKAVITKTEEDPYETVEDLKKRRGLTEEAETD